ncbi:MAG: DNA repair protein RecN [Treponema sp.]|nr:DNA repair protein RecN [Treponema sp.]
MLEQLDIKNFALIDFVSLEFNSGFTVLSGETGAGKSILIGALSFVLGGKAGVEQIRAGTTEASVSASFVIPPSELTAEISQWLVDHGIELDNDRVLLRRYIRSTGKSAAWIQDVAVTRADLATFSSFLIDIHGQHEHQSLMKVPEHRVFLDNWAGLQSTVADYSGLFVELVEKRKKLAEFNSNQADLQRQIDMLTFAVQEIESAKLQSGEDVRLEEEEARLSSFEKLYADIEEITALFDASGEAEGVISLLKKMRTPVSHASQMDKNLESLQSRLDSAFYELSDISEEFRSYFHSLVFDPERLTEVQDRLSVLYNLKKKYAATPASSIDEVIAYGDKAKEELVSLDFSEEGKEALKTECEELDRKVYAAAKALSAKRQEAARKMSKEIEAVLSVLGMPNTRFSVHIADKPGTEVVQKCGLYGMDDIEFLISANPGAPLLPLAKIASGGELSRVMLALKTVFAKTDPVSTLIFDEIDTGIGGEIAVAVGSHMRKLSENSQILCITHLASIAVYADNQVKVEKKIENGVMKTNVFSIDGEKRVVEIARMLAGDTSDEQSLEHARSMLQRIH